MTAYFVLRTPSGPVRFRVNAEARDYEAVLVREEDMDAGLLLFALVDAALEDAARSAEFARANWGYTDAAVSLRARARLGQWRALWWGTR